MSENEQAPDLARLDVMVIEENSQIRILFRQLLRDFGVGTVREAVDGKSALKELVVMPANLVICGDWPDGPGGDIRFLRSLRTASEPSVARTPVILVTGRADAKHVAQARDAGANEFLIKPVSPKALHARVLAALAKPRPFVEAGAFRGPDRRRGRVGPSGLGRREEDKGDAPAQPDATKNPEPSKA